MDDPVATQPRMYDKIHQHPTLRVRYAEQLKAEGVIMDDKIKSKEKEIQEELSKAYQKVKDVREKEQDDSQYEKIPGPLPDVDTGVSVETLREINRDLLKWPKGFTVYPKLEKVLQRRAAILEEDNKMDWSLAETLAFATILKDGTGIRFTGQDTERGTFAHRHLVLHDSKTGETHCPLHTHPAGPCRLRDLQQPAFGSIGVGF